MENYATALPLVISCKSKNTQADMQIIQAAAPSCN